jgi:hypothetical protein
MATALRLEQTEYLDASEAASILKRRLDEPRSNLRRLDDEAQKRGYKKITGPKGDFGLRQTYQAANPVRAPKGERGEPVQKIEFELSLSSYEDPDSDTQAAVASVRIVADSNTEVYDMLLETDGGDFQEVREFKVEREQVVRANSWWTAARDCVFRNCGGVCIGALLTCSGTWAAYLACFAVVCGGCWLKCAACATCNCKWWCKWATGCCRT